VCDAVLKEKEIIELKREGDNPPPATSSIIHRLFYQELALQVVAWPRHPRPVLLSKDKIFNFNPFEYIGQNRADNRDIQIPTVI